MKVLYNKHQINSSSIRSFVDRASLAAITSEVSSFSTIVAGNVIRPLSFTITASIGTAFGTITSNVTRFAAVVTTGFIRLSTITSYMSSTITPVTAILFLAIALHMSSTLALVALGFSATGRVVVTPSTTAATTTSPTTTTV